MAEEIEMPFGLWTRVGPRKHVLYGTQIPNAKGQLLGGKGHARACQTTLCHELCKMAEPIDLQFGLWTRVGQRKHKFNRICQVAPVCLLGGHIGVAPGGEYD